MKLLAALVSALVALVALVAASDALAHHENLRQGIQAEFRPSGDFIIWEFLLMTWGPFLLMIGVLFLMIEVLSMIQTAVCRLANYLKNYLKERGE